MQGIRRSINVAFRYADNVISLNNSKSSIYVVIICHIELEIKNTIYTSKSLSYLNILIEINNGKCQLNV